MNEIKTIQRNISGKFTFERTETGEFINLKGDDYELLAILSKYMKFSYKIIEKPRSLPLGEKMYNGNWTGVFGMFQRDEIDMMVGIPKEWTSSEVVDYSLAFETDEATFVISKAGLKPKDFIYISPFQLTVWVYVILTVCFCSIFLTVLRRCGKEPKSKALIRELYNSAELVARNFGLHRRNLYTKFPTRLFLGVCCLGTMILRFSYLSVFFSLLMAPITETQISTFEQLAVACRKNEAKFTAIAGTSTQRMLFGTESQILKDISKEIRKNPQTLLSSVQMRPALQKGYAVLLSRHILEMIFVGDEKVFISPHSAWSIQISIAFRKTFCCKRKFDVMMRRVQEAGIYGKLAHDATFRFYFKSLENKADKNDDDDIIRPIGISDIIGILWLASAFYTLSILAFFFELCKLKNSKKNRMNNTGVGYGFNGRRRRRHRFENMVTTF